MVALLLQLSVLKSLLWCETPAHAHCRDTRVVVLLNSGTNAWNRFELRLHKHMND